MMASCFCCARPNSAPLCERCEAMHAELRLRRDGMSGPAERVRDHWRTLPRFDQDAVGT